MLLLQSLTRQGNEKLDEDIEMSDIDGNLKPSLTSQLLLLYYLLLYEDTRMANSSAFIAAGKHVMSYSSEFMSELPIKYLLQQAQKDQSSFGGNYLIFLNLVVPTMNIQKINPFAFQVCFRHF